MDVTNRIRDERGRLLGYKPGTQPERVQTKKKDPTRESLQKSESTPKKRAKIKMPFTVPALATPELQVEVRRLLTKQTFSIEAEPTLPADILQDAGISRARSIRPTSYFHPEAALQHQRESQPEGEKVPPPEASGPEAVRDTTGEEDVEIPASQPQQDAERPATPGGDSQRSEGLDEQR